ncbi:hypothetical protein D6T17_26325 [Salmonella enterica subsp. enterica serovar Oranienburg]|nr:hypothetical protein [Salmonella enterica subsp. enterica serovar Rubislaw]EBV1275452.1 hypothetical protein [Salmonella enterica subsp. enterica serovar Oranienburg]EBY8947750.1 hypothetical protein [Salmonella enterica subsp. enterica serovar Oranienburg]
MDTPCCDMASVTGVSVGGA